VRQPRTGVDREIAVRCGFIDAPELEQPGGYEARNFLTALIGGRSLELTVLFKMDTGKIVDRHGRIVSVPYLRMDDPQSRLRRLSSLIGTAPAYRNIELEMILNGWAWLIERYGPEDRYFEALQDAQSYGRGIWSRTDNVPPWDFKRDRYRSRRNARSSAPQPKQLPLQEPSDRACPEKECDGRLVERKGRFGAFLGCSNFPTCRYSRGP
jgi:endonuclease YncB( thermonuclease family)